MQCCALLRGVVVPCLRFVGCWLLLLVVCCSVCCCCLLFAYVYVVVYCRVVLLVVCCLLFDVVGCLFFCWLFVDW